VGREGSDMTDEEIARRLRAAVKEFNAAMDAVQHAGLVVEIQTTLQSISGFMYMSRKDRLHPDVEIQRHTTVTL
jgi:hypothetical protein